MYVLPSIKSLKLALRQKNLSFPDIILRFMTLRKHFSPELAHQASVFSGEREQFLILRPYAPAFL